MTPTTLSSPRIPPVPPSGWTPEVLDVFELVEGPKAREKGANSPLILMLGNHPELASGFLNFSLRLLRASTLTGRLREMLTLRVAWRTQCEYEWGHHVVLGEKQGISPQEIESIKAGDYAGFTDLERHTLNAVDELFTRSQVEDATWAGLAAHLSHTQLMDLVFTIGSYAMLAWVTNATGVRIEPGEPGLDWSAAG